MQSEGGTAGAVRPEPGLARGVWEAPRGVFVAALVLVALAAAAWIARVALAKARRRAR